MTGQTGIHGEGFPPASLEAGGKRPFGVVILASGESGLGRRPLQLATLRGRTLLSHAVRTAMASGAAQVVVVLGSRAEKHQRQLRWLPATVVIDRKWKEGRSSAIRAGVSALTDSCEAVVLLPCELPRITPGHVRDLAERTMGLEGVAVAASAYEGLLGAPCAFSRAVFAHLLALRDSKGARDLVRQFQGPMAVLPFEDGNRRDVDVPKSDDSILEPERPALWQPRLILSPRAPPAFLLNPIRH